MLSASHTSADDAHDKPAVLLLDALNDLLRAVDGRVILLRTLPQRFDWRRDDIDLLLTDVQRLQLIQAARSSCLQGRLHCRIRQHSKAKIALTLWTIDCSEKLMIDLWTSFDQLPNQPRKSISAARLLSALDSLTRESESNSIPKVADSRIPALSQLPPDIDLCLLMQHLARKRKSLSMAVTRERILSAIARLAAWSPNPRQTVVPHEKLEALRAASFELGKAIIVTRNNIALSEDYLVQRLSNTPGNRGLRILERRQSRPLFTGLRNTILKRRPVLAVIGSDGAGKSSTAAALAQRQPGVKVEVAKKLYRRSLSYQIISHFFRTLFGKDRGQFDDHFSAMVTLRAIPAMVIKMLQRQQRSPQAIEQGQQSDTPSGMLSWSTVQDRSVASFLITNRKSDWPALSRGATWIEPFIPPVTSVLILMPHAELTLRKQEMSVCGHDEYQRLLFEQALRQKPSDVILLASTDSAAAAAEAIEIIGETTNIVVKVATSTEQTPVRKVAA